MRPHNARIAAAITRNFAEANEAAARRAARACGIDMDELQRIVPKLRHIRDKTHFHIDKRTVEDPAMVWSDANLSRGELTKALRNAAVLLANIRNHVHGENGDVLTRYDGADVSMIVDACAEAARRAEK